MPDIKVIKIVRYVFPLNGDCQNLQAHSIAKVVSTRML